jgi:hypothetical protein
MPQDEPAAERTDPPPGTPSRWRRTGAKLVLVGALLVLILTSRAGWRTKTPRAATMLLPLAVIGAFAGYLYLLTDSRNGAVLRLEPVSGS